LEIPAVQYRRCKHCDKPVPEPGRDYCCSGCEAAFQILSNLDGGKYYSARAGTPPDEQSRSSASHAAEQTISELDPEALKVQFQIHGIHCAGCVWLLESLPERVPGILKARVNLAQGAIQIDYRPAHIPLPLLQKTIEGLGYRLSFRKEPASPDSESRTNLYRIGVAAFASMNTMMLAVSLFQGFYSGIDADTAHLFRWVSFALTVPVVTFCAWPFYRNSIAGARLRTIHIDLPLSLAIIAAFGLSSWNTINSSEYVYFDSVCALVFLLLCGRWIQARALARARSESAISWTLIPTTAVRLSGSSEEEVDVANLNENDLIRVAPLDRFPADGTIVAGRSSVDNAVLTGESLPQILEPGTEISAGTLNLEAPVSVRVRSAGQQSRVGRILKEIESQPRPDWGVVGFVDRASAWFTLTVILGAAIGGLWWLQYDGRRALEVAITFLIVTCPCALGIATPLALGIALGRGARRGIFVKSVESLERIVQARSVFFDKTGTLTESELTVTDVAFTRGAEKARILALSATESSHPVARSVRHFAQAKTGSTASVKDFRQVPSRGVELLEEGEVVARLGSELWMKELKQVFPEDLRERAASSDESGASLVFFSDATGHVSAIFFLRDTIKLGAAELIETLASENREIYLLSGDRRDAVQHLSERLRIPSANTLSECSPEHKAAVVAAHDRTCFIGDGVNDAPAMRAAGVSIGVTGGFKAALEVADIFVSAGEIADLREVFAASKRLLKVVHRNLIFSVIYNVIGGALALTGQMNPLIAALLMPASSLTVIAHSMASRTFTRKE